MLVDEVTPEANVQSPDAERDDQLVGVLQDLIARDGRDAVASQLGVSERTLRRALSTGQLSSGLVKKLEPLADGANGLQLDLLKRQVSALESRIAELEREANGPAVVEDDEGLSEQVVSLEDRLQDVERQLALVSVGLAELREAQPAAVAPTPDTPAPASPQAEPATDVPRRIYPERVELQPRPDDEQVYGSEVFALISEWREQHAEFKAHWPTIPGYVAEIRMVDLEVGLIGEHKLTFSSDEPPWPNWRRRQELQDRAERLEVAHTKLRKKRIRRFFLRLLTLGLWGR